MVDDGPVRRKLIEVAMPLDAVSREAAREKSIRFGHPSTVHLWWSRKPLAAARAVLFAQLVDDPAVRPDQFPGLAEQEAERQRLLDLVARLARWEATTDDALMAEVRAEIATAVSARAGGAPTCSAASPAVADPAPDSSATSPRSPVVLWDPFAGGGSIPFEGQRLGLPALSGDLNPVAVLLERALLELPRRWQGSPAVLGGRGGLAADLRGFGARVLAAAARQLRPLYPRVRYDGVAYDVLAYLWVRTVPCGNPGCSATVPMLSNPWLRRTGGREAWLRSCWDGQRLRFEVVHDVEAVVRTGRGAVFDCVACGTSTTVDDVKGRAREGGLGRALRCVVVDTGGGQRRFLTLDEDEVCPASIEDVEDALLDGDTMLDVELDPAVTNAPTYGLLTVADLHLPRQRRALEVMAAAVRGITVEIRDTALAAGLAPTEADAYARDLTVLLGLVLGRLSNRMSIACIWNAHRGLVEQTFIQNTAIAFPWDFAEANPLSGGSGSWATQLELVARVVQRCDPAADAKVVRRDARDLPAELAGCRVVVSTDPPYFDYFLYSSLSDYFYVWLRRALADAVPDLFAEQATPRAEEIVARHVDGERSGERFLGGLTAAMTTIARAASPDFPITVYYAYRCTRSGRAGLGAWEAFLGAVRAAGLQVTATWPIRTERPEGVKTGRNSLASSIVVVVRRRPAHASNTDRERFLARLRREVPAALDRLQAGGISPVDLAQAALGPGMAVYTGYAGVVDDAGHALPEAEALRLINQVLDGALHGPTGDLDPMTGFCLDWLRQYGFEPGPRSRAVTLAAAAGTGLPQLSGRGLLAAGTGTSTVCLLPPREAVARMPGGAGKTAATADGSDHPTIAWELVLRLAVCLADAGPVAAAQLLRTGPGEVAPATCRRLVYRMYELFLRRGRGRDAALLNALGTALPKLLRAARSPVRPPVEQDD